MGGIGRGIFKGASDLLGDGLGLLFDAGAGTVKGAAHSLKNEVGPSMSTPHVSGEETFFNSITSFFSPDDSPGNETPSKEARGQFVDDLSSGMAGKVSTAVGTYAMVSALNEGRLEDSPNNKAFQNEKDDMVEALKEQGLSFEESERYRKSFLASENIKPLNREDFSSQAAFREANYVQFDGAIGIKADNNGISREDTMKKGAEESSMLGNFAMIGTVIAAAFALFKLFEDNESVQKMFASAKEMLGGGANTLMDKAEELINDPLGTLSDAAGEKISETVSGVAHKYLPDFMLNAMGMNDSEESGAVNPGTPTGDGENASDLTTLANASAAEREGKTTSDEISALVDAADKDVGVDVSAGQSRGM